MTTTITLTQGIGYRGQQGERCYIARITGTSDRYGLERDFVDPARVERDSFSRARYTRSYHYDLPVGLYEISEHGERRYLIVWAKRDGTIARFNPEADRVEAMARLMADGMDVEAARIATKPAPTPQVAHV